MIRALTLRQPFADLVVRGIKPIENRDWTTRYRGRFIIASAKQLADQEGWEFCEEILKRKLDRRAYVRGALVGAVELVDIVTDHPSPWFVGDYGFVLRKPERFKPLPCRGNVGFWYLSKAQEAREIGEDHDQLSQRNGTRNGIVPQIGYDVQSVFWFVSAVPIEVRPEVLFLHELDGRDRPLAIVALNRNPKPVQIVKPYVLDGSCFAIGKNDGSAN